MSQNESAHVVAKPIRPVKEKSSVSSNRRLWARLCYYYPQYTLEMASRLSARDINLLLNTARRIEAERMNQLVQIVASPHTEKGKGVKQLTNYFQSEMEK